MKHILLISLLFLASLTAALCQDAKPTGTNPLLVASYYDRIGRALKNPKKTTPIGSPKNGNAFTSLPTEGALLVGLAVNKGDWFGSPIISALQPIYETRAGRMRGNRVGKRPTIFRSSWRRSLDMSSVSFS